MFTFRDIEGHLIKLPMINLCTKVYLHDTPPGIGLTTELISSLCIYCLTGVFLAPSHCTFPLLVTEGLHPSHIIFRKVKGTLQEILVHL